MERIAVHKEYLKELSTQVFIMDGKECKLVLNKKENGTQICFSTEADSLPIKFEIKNIDEVKRPEARDALFFIGRILGLCSFEEENMVLLDKKEEFAVLVEAYNKLVITHMLTNDKYRNHMSEELIKMVS